VSARIATLRHKRENFYQVLMLIFGVLLWVVVALVVLGATESPEGIASLMTALFYVIGFFLYYFFGPLFYRAYAYGNMILMGRSNFPPCTTWWFRRPAISVPPSRRSPSCITRTA
jgi:hypothetical protein